MTNEYLIKRTLDSRLEHHKFCGGETHLYSMYSSNFHVEGDGLGYHELNFLRAILLEPILYSLMGCNMVLAYAAGYSKFKSRGIKLCLLRNSFHLFGVGLNISRYFISIIIFLTEFFFWPFRIAFGIMLSPIAIPISAGHIYALPLSVLHDLTEGAGVVVIRKVKMNLICSQPQTLNAGGLGQVHCYITDSAAKAMHIASVLKIKQRCGVGPECVWIRGRRVFVSNWSPINLTSVFGNATTEWKLLDITTMEWRRTVFDIKEETLPDLKTIFEIDTSSITGARKQVQWAARLWSSVQNAVRRCNEVRKELWLWITRGNAVREVRSCDCEDLEKEEGKWASVRSSEDLGLVSSLADLELYYTSPLGWNKYHRMQADGRKIRVTRQDRRALSHVIAAVTSLLLYAQFRDSSQGWLGLSIELYALVIANYTLITAYAAQILVGKTSDVVEAKSDRYGVIVTRAIDRGYVRGIHVLNGEWLHYETGDSSLPVHEIKSTEVNVTCNSFVYESDQGPMIKAVPYHTHLPSKDYRWNP